MKNDFKIGQSIIIEKPGILNGLPGKIIGINTESDTIYKPLRVECESGYIIALELHEIKGYIKPSENKDKPTEDTETSVQAFEELNIKVVKSDHPIGCKDKPAKRSYTKRGTKPVKEVKPKRTYNRKHKLI